MVEWMCEHTQRRLRKHPDPAGVPAKQHTANLRKTVLDAAIAATVTNFGRALQELGTPVIICKPGQHQRVSTGRRRHRARPSPQAQEITTEAPSHQPINSAASHQPCAPILEGPADLHLPSAIEANEATLVSAAASTTESARVVSQPLHPVDHQLGFSLTAASSQYNELFAMAARPDVRARAAALIQSAALAAYQSGGTGLNLAAAEFVPRAAGQPTILFPATVSAHEANSRLGDR